jgi:hypothetical protein
MNIIKKIKALLKTNKDNVFSESNDEKHINNKYESSSVGLRQREQELYGMDRIQQQKLYEKWIIKKTWLLKDEAIPLLCGVNPELKINTKSEAMQFAELWEHAQQCINQGLLSVTEAAVKPENWQVQPQDVYKWAAISRVDIPEQLSAIMEFVLSTVKHTDNNILDTKNLKNTDSIGDDKERVLGAAFAILAAYPDQCRNSKGRVRANKIVEILDEKGEFWFGKDTLSMSSTAKLDLINRWLQTIC